MTTKNPNLRPVLPEDTESIPNPETLNSVEALSATLSRAIDDLSQSAHRIADVVERKARRAPLDLIVHYTTYVLFFLALILGTWFTARVYYNKIWQIELVNRQLGSYNTITREFQFQKPLEEDLKSLEKKEVLGP